jgi:hypothetical protein
MRFLLCILLSGCALQPGQYLIARDVWVRDMDFEFKRLEWVHVTGPDAWERTARLCRDDPDDFMRKGSTTCAIRIKESGLLLVYSIFSEERAKTFQDMSGESVYVHELRHGGVGMPSPGGWNHLRP